jgi:hypothetical protein
MFNWFDGWMALGGASIVGLLVAAWFFPGHLRKWALAAAGVLAATSFIRQKGLNDGARKKQSEWDAAEKRMVEKGTEARRDAQRDADAGSLPDDGFDRDKGEVRRP